MPRRKSKQFFLGIGAFVLVIGILSVSYLNIDKEASMHEKPQHKLVLMYSKSTCPYCVAAKKLFNTKGVSFQEIDINHYPEKRDEMLAKANGRTTVPQIFIGDIHVGGFTDLVSLEQNGKLEALLKN
ncbi:MAG: glutaredoxin 3 [Oligoflexales bacterium]